MTKDTLSSIIEELSDQNGVDTGKLQVELAKCMWRITVLLTIAAKLDPKSVDIKEADALIKEATQVLKVYCKKQYAITQELLHSARKLGFFNVGRKDKRK